MQCEKCKIPFQIYAFVMSNGAKVVVNKCPNCGTHADYDRMFLPVKNYNWDELPIWADNTTDAHPCEYKDCSSVGTELHHFAPKQFFKDADNWPQSYLCKYHHKLWHDTINKH